MKAPIRILFMCVANSARSQLAEGLGKEILGANAEVQSAGSRPSHVNPFAVRVLDEISINISQQKSKSTDVLSPEFLSKLDYIITLCAEEVCPIILSHAKKLHWPLPDPATSTGTEEEKLKRFQVIRDELQIRIHELKIKLESES